MLDHLGIVVSDLARSRRFYEACLAPPGLKVLEEAPGNGAPGPRQASYPYYAAFVLDPDHNNIEAGVRV